MVTADQRPFIIASWLVGIYLPSWLDLVPDLSAEAQLAKGLPKIVPGSSIKTVRAGMIEIKERVKRLYLIWGLDTAGRYLKDPVEVKMALAVGKLIGDIDDLQRTARDVELNEIVNGAVASSRRAAVIAVRDALPKRTEPKIGYDVIAETVDTTLGRVARELAAHADVLYQTLLEV